MVFKLLKLYVILINIYGIFIMYYDKHKAKKREWRVPELRLFITAAIFGSVGIWLGMYLFHHKTKHLKFVIGIPVILLIQIIVILKYFI